MRTPEQEAAVALHDLLALRAEAEAKLATATWYESLALRRMLRCLDRTTVAVTDALSTVEADLAYWQVALGLTAWTVDVRVVRAWDMPVTGALGSCSRCPEAQQAVIHLLDPDDHGFAAFPVDPEVVLVHELLHCYHSTPESGTSVELLEEQGLWATARALVRLRRAAPKEGK